MDLFHGRIFQPQLQDYNIDVLELDNNDLKCAQPDNIRIDLKPHQLTLIKKCISRENEIQFKNLSLDGFNCDVAITNIGIIGDHAGSGKSYSCLGLILSNDITCHKRAHIKSFGMDNITIYVQDNFKVIKTNLIVIPHNLTAQWEDSIKTLKQSIKYRIINREKAFNMLFRNEFQLDELEILVITAPWYNKLSKWCTENQIKFQRIFFDEVDSLNLTGSQIYANFTWFVTASYGNLLYPRGYNKYDNILGEYKTLSAGLKTSSWIKSIFVDITQHLPHNFMRMLVIKNNKHYVDQSFELPPCKNSFIKCKTPHSIKLLSGLVDKNIIACLNAGDKEGALNLISSTHKSNQDGIVQALVSKYNRQISNLKLKSQIALDYQYTNQRERNGDYQEKINCLQNKIDQIESRIRNDVMCPICLQDFDNQSVTQCCKNSYCFTCINQWLKRNQSCPCCKEKLHSSELYIIDNNLENTIISDYDQDHSKISINNDNDKLHNLELLLRDSKNCNKKILIFSCYDGSFRDIIPTLHKLDFNWSFLKGNSTQISSYVRRYKTGNLDILLINAKNYGSGLNLENTTDLIMFHKFDTQAQQQIVGRAYRPGRTQPLNVHYLLYDNELQS